jgi:hypothetical protein
MDLVGAIDMGRGNAPHIRRGDCTPMATVHVTVARVG